MNDSMNDFVSDGLLANGPVRPYVGSPSTVDEQSEGPAMEDSQNASADASTDASATTSSKGGRPRVLDEKKRAEICAQLAAGCTFRTAARYVGCTAAAISMLMKRDEEFRWQVNRALAQREIIPLSHIRAASSRAWQAAAWLLERTVKGTYLPGNLSDPADIGRAVDKELQEEVIGRITALEART